MNTTTRISTAERLGRRLGCGWRCYVRQERHMVDWLIGRGMPKAGAVALMWCIKLAVLGTLLYVAVWLALLLVFLVFVARGYDSSVDLTTPEAEWRYGQAGYGLYTSDGYRIDPHDPNDPHST